MDIRGHAAVVTGGGSGLGAATARMLAQAGAKVALFDVNQKAAAEVAIDIHGFPNRVVGRDGRMPLADFERVIRINLNGTFNAMRLAAAAMQPLEALQDG